MLLNLTPLSLKLSFAPEKSRRCFHNISSFVYMLFILKNSLQYNLFFCKNCNRIFLWLCPSLVHISQTLMRLFVNLHLLLVCLQKFSIPAATSLAKHFNFPIWANICYFNKVFMKVEVYTVSRLFLPHSLFTRTSFTKYCINCNKEVLSICVAINFFHTYLQLLRKLKTDTLTNRIWYFYFR